jgi:hypothetical protein
MRAAGQHLGFDAPGLLAGAIKGGGRDGSGGLHAILGRAALVALVENPALPLNIIAESISLAARRIRDEQ